MNLFSNQVSSYIGHHGDWFWPAAAGVNLIIASIALRWIVVLVAPTDRAGDIPVPVATTIWQAAALTREISTYRGVDNACGRVVG